MNRAAIGCCGLLILLSGESASSGGALERGYFRVKLTSGAVKKTASRPAPPPETRFATVSATIRNGSLVILDRPDGVREARIRFELPIGKPSEFMPWSIVRGRYVVFCWRELVDAAPSTYRDVVMSLDLETKRVLWRHEIVQPKGPSWQAGMAVFPFYEHGVVFAEPQVLKIVDGVTGTTIREIPRSGHGFDVMRVDETSLLVNAGKEIELLDVPAAKTIWKLELPQGGAFTAAVARVDQNGSCPQAGATDSGLGRAADWLVTSGGQVSRVDPKNGSVRWTAPTASLSNPCLAAGRSYEAWLGAGRDRDHLAISLVVRNLDDGKVLRRYPVESRQGFHDQIVATVYRADAVSADVATEWLVLE